MYEIEEIKDHNRLKEILKEKSKEDCLIVKPPFFSPSSKLVKWN